MEAYANWDLTKLPFRLCRTEKTITRTDDAGNVFPLKRWLCHIEIDPEFGLLLQQSTQLRYRAELTGSQGMRSLGEAVTFDTAADWVNPDELEPVTFTAPSTTNPNRELLKRIGQITGHSSKQIAEILETNFPGRKSDSLSDLELRTVVDTMCIDAAVRSGMDAGTAQASFSHWLGQQDPEIGNEQLAKGWMGQLDT